MPIGSQARAVRRAYESYRESQGKGKGDYCATVRLRSAIQFSINRVSVSKSTGLVM
jgi:hypothetical protein